MPPRVAVGLFVYNGDNYLPETFDSLLGQTFGDFVINVSDNGSTDGTEELCRDYQRADDRVVYHRHEVNRGATWNTNYVATLGRECEFFKWCAHDDVYDPTYLETCVATLDERPEVVACQPRARYIDGNGDEIMRSFRHQGLDDPSPSVRMAALACTPHDYTFDFAVIRRSVFDRARPHAPIADADLVMLCDLALQGPFAEPDAHLFGNRIHARRATASTQTSDWRARAAAWSGGAVRTMPTWDLVGLLLEGVRDAPISPAERARCALVVARFSRRWWRDLAFETPRLPARVATYLRSGEPEGAAV